MMRVEALCNELGATHVEMVVDGENFRFVMEVADVSRASATSDDPECLVLDGLKAIDIGSGGDRGPAGTSVIHGGADELLV